MRMRFSLRKKCGIPSENISEEEKRKSTERRKERTDMSELTGNSSRALQSFIAERRKGRPRYYACESERRPNERSVTNIIGPAHDEKYLGGRICCLSAGRPSQ